MCVCVGVYIEMYDMVTNAVNLKLFIVNIFFYTFYDWQYVCSLHWFTLPGIFIAKRTRFIYIFFHSSNKKNNFRVRCQWYTLQVLHVRPVSSTFDFAPIVKMGKQGNFRGKKASKKGNFL